MDTVGAIIKRRLSASKGEEEAGPDLPCDHRDIDIVFMGYKGRRKEDAPFDLP
jgi:hypothetical protein